MDDVKKNVLIDKKVNSEGYQEGKQTENEVDNRRNIWYPYGACISTSVSSFVKLDFYTKMMIYD